MTKGRIFGKQGFFARIGKRNLIVIAALLLIGVAVYLNYLWFFDPAAQIGYGNHNMTDTSTGGNVTDTTPTQSYFSAAQLSREQARDEALEVLQTVVASEDALPETKDAALSDISRIALDMEQEANVESLVMAKGFSNCVAVLNGATISVIVETNEGLLPNQVAQIKEIVYEQTGIKPASVKIIEKAAEA